MSASVVTLHSHYTAKLREHIRQASLNATPGEHVELTRLAWLVRAGQISPRDAHQAVSDMRAEQRARAA